MLSIVHSQRYRSSIGKKSDASSTCAIPDKYLVRTVLESAVGLSARVGDDMKACSLAKI